MADRFLLFGSGLTIVVATGIGAGGLSHAAAVNEAVSPVGHALEQCPVDTPSLIDRLTAIIGQIREMPDNTWRRVNENTFASVQMPRDWNPACPSIVGPNGIINAWGGFAYDSTRGDLITFGGGHGDYCGNDIYRFRLSTQRWERAGISSQMTTYQMAPNLRVALPSEGLVGSPATAHMYDGLTYLPVANRMIYFGYGTPSFAGSGAPPLVASLPPQTGPWFFDPSKADPNRAVGNDGSAVDPSFRGGQMWENREYASRHPGSWLPAGYGPQTASTDTVCEGGKDAVYVRTSGKHAVSSGLAKYTVDNVDNPLRDELSAVGALTNDMSQADMAVDTNHGVAVLMGSERHPFAFWDLSLAGPRNPMRRVAEIRDPTGSFRANRNMGMDYDPVRRRFLVWDGASGLWALRLPDTVPVGTTGWEVSRIESNGGPTTQAPQTGGGSIGKWKYAPGLDIFVGLREAPNGDVWLFKPAAWTDPARKP